MHTCICKLIENSKQYRQKFMGDAHRPCGDCVVMFRYRIKVSRWCQYTVADVGGEYTFMWMASLESVESFFFCLLCFGFKFAFLHTLHTYNPF